MTETKEAPFTLEDFKGALFNRNPMEAKAALDEYEQPHYQADFKGRKYKNGEDWRFPFSHCLADAIFKGRDERIEKLQKGGLQPTELHSASEQFTDFGTSFLNLLSTPGAVIVDLGCGVQGRSTVPKTLSTLCGAEYIGMDLDEELREGVEMVNTHKGPRTHSYIRDRILQFLAKIGSIENAVFYLSGIELETGRPLFPGQFQSSENYTDAVLGELRRLGCPIVIGPATKPFYPERQGFTEGPSMSTMTDIGEDGGGSVSHTLWHPGSKVERKPEDVAHDTRRKIGESTATQAI